MNVRPFPERVLNGVVRRGIRLPSALAAAQKHASLGRREAGGGGCSRGSRGVGSLDHLPPSSHPLTAARWLSGSRASRIALIALIGFCTV